MNVPAPLVDDCVLGTGEGVRVIHLQCVELAETQPEAVHEFMENAARAVAMRYCSHGDRPPQALQGNSRAARLASLKHGHPGLYGVHQAEIIAGLDPALILEKHGTLSCRTFRNEVCFAAAKALNFQGEDVQAKRAECFTHAARALYPGDEELDRWLRAALG